MQSKPRFCPSDGLLCKNALRIDSSLFLDAIEVSQISVRRRSVGVVLNSSSTFQLGLAKVSTMAWVVFYDIRKDKARCRVAKKLVRAGIRIQKSVFLVEATPQQVRAVIDAIAKEIDFATDTVAAWQLSHAWQTTQHCYPKTATPLTESFVIA